MSVQSPQAAKIPWQQKVAGPLSGIGVLCLILAKNWVVLTMGWSCLAVMILFAVLAKTEQNAGHDREAPLFELGPAIAVNLKSVRRWILPLGIFVLLLGMVSFLIPEEELSGPSSKSYGLFLCGVGIVCIAMRVLHKGLMVAGYLLWGIAGGLICFDAMSLDSEFETAKLMTLGVLLAFGGLLAAIGVAKSKGHTEIHENGMMIAGNFVEWKKLQDLIFDEIDGRPTLLVKLGGVKQTIFVHPANVEEVRPFVEEKLGKQS